MKSSYRSLFEKIGKQKILVIGDFIFDVYLKGECSRIAPEASVPIVDQHAKKMCLGGAANAAANLQALGAEVLFCTVTGKDNAFEEAAMILKAKGIDTANIVNDAERKTLVKTRICAQEQTIVRVDEGTTSFLNPTTEAKLMELLELAYAQVNAVLIADYAKGVLTDGVIQLLEQLNLETPKFIAVDAKNFERYACLKPNLIKPNFTEASLLATEKILTKDRVLQVPKWQEQLAQKTQAKHILLTMDQDGVAYFNRDKFVCHFEVPQIQDAKVSGAGDTFISACLLAMLAGSNYKEAIIVAIQAAAIAIKKVDTSICSQSDLLSSLVGNEKCLDQQTLLDIVKHKKKMGQRIVFTNGCFDILHSGHVNYLRAAKEKGDVLIVGLNNDDSIVRLKGPTRPINTLKDRIAVLAELNCIDYIIPYGQPKDDTPIPLIGKIKPHVFVKGGDYQFKYLPEETILKKLNCEIVFIPLTANKSTSRVIAKIRNESSTQFTVPYN